MSQKRISSIFGVGARRPRFTRYALAPHVFLNPLMTLHICENGGNGDNSHKLRKTLDLVLTNALLTAHGRLSTSCLLLFCSLVRAPTEPFKRNDRLLDIFFIRNYKPDEAIYPSLCSLAILQLGS